mmetsp:Transcript_24020/g.47710  ORF Transcript_24020/g.47710 Transcript_24020/m.47710 type:complete len:245 (+) Transcript_24020:346-1080(+)
MKLITAIISVFTIAGANGKSSKASTKASKSKSSKARCNDSSLSFSSSPKSGKSHLSLSSKSGKDDRSCLPCSLGDGYLGTNLCGTNVGFCEFSIRDDDDFTVDSCDANDCTPDCVVLEPLCDQCALASIVGATCPLAEGVCEFTFSAGAEPSCVISDCVIDQDEVSSCGLCSTAPPGLGCPDVEGYCQADTVTDGNGIECTACGDTACPDFTFDECSDPPEGGARRLEMGNKEWIFGINDVFQW